ncbi:MAG: hypothetical protein ACNS61_01160 [Candidatus Wenzhouxiangella sp. M2_3B_020]
MSENNDNRKPRPGPDESPDTGTDRSDGYIDHVRSVLTAPDAVFDANRRGDRGHAVIDMGIYLAAVFLAALIARVTGYAGWDFEFGYIIDAVKSVLTIGIPIGLAIFALNYFGSGAGESRSTDFYFEKIAAGLVLPALLLLGAVILDLLDIRIHGWLRGLSMAFIYVLVFLAAYGYCAPGKLKTAAAFLAGFYIVYRLLALLF